jgi:hypothetical protein
MEFQWKCVEILEIIATWSGKRVRLRAGALTEPDTSTGRDGRFGLILWFSKT